MALQIMSGTIHGIGKEKEILYDDGDPQITITDTLKPICDEFFQERNFVEGDDEIAVSIVPFNGMRPLSFRIEKEALRILSSMINIDDKVCVNSRGVNTRFYGEFFNEQQLKPSTRQLMRLISMRSYIISELTQRPLSSDRIIRINYGINNRRINILSLLRGKRHDKKSNQYTQAVYNYLKQGTAAYLEKINEPEVRSVCMTANNASFVAS